MGSKRARGKLIVFLCVVVVSSLYFVMTRQDEGYSLIEFLHEGRAIKQVYLAELIAKIPVQGLLVRDPHVRDRELGFKVFTAEALLTHIYGERLLHYQALEISCSDGYRVVIPRNDLERGDGYFAFARQEGGSFTLINHLANPHHPRRQELGPLYLVWDSVRHPELGSVTSAAWPFQIVRFDLLDQLPGAQTIPPPSRDATSEVKQGYELYRRYCLNCHNSLDADSAPNQIPSLRQLVQAVNEKGFTWFHQWVNNPASLKPGAKMPPVNLAIPELNDIIRYMKSL